ncbi:MAG: PQQ-dependent sugar dehydrogenase [Planctomycetes bacterium]|nr:PQQ-dependent sugar dehydrogenase [Planctomycetota bacterium]
MKTELTPGTLKRFVACGLALILLSCSSVVAAEINTKPLALKGERAFPNLRFRMPGMPDAPGIPGMPVIFTNAGDGSDRIFIGDQWGVIHVFPNDHSVKKTTKFLDFKKKVVYKPKQNEEGFLGLAFHPKYKQNGQFFVYYTTRDAPQTSVISRFRVSKDDPNKADPDSEQELMRIKQPFWNHNGGTIVFGPDGYLYVALGDGGSAKDPMGNGQNLGTILGTILRIDVDHHDRGKAYAVPKDNPFVDHKGARPEIWAYGLRNPWRITFDRKTGDLWCGDVGQDLWEEINIITKGGNYGWNRREAKHKFGPKGVGPNIRMIEPIWEYHHKVGKSITGGHVHRGKRLPQLEGGYLYADYVSGKIWALWYDKKTGKVTANRPIQDKKLPIITFGEDEQGATYFTDYFGMINRFVATEK